jgi:hypothetical protein
LSQALSLVAMLPTAKSKEYWIMCISSWARYGLNPAQAYRPPGRVRGRTILAAVFSLKSVFEEVVAVEASMSAMSTASVPPAQGSTEPPSGSGSRCIRFASAGQIFCSSESIRSAANAASVPE